MCVEFLTENYSPQVHTVPLSVCRVICELCVVTAKAQRRGYRRRLWKKQLILSLKWPSRQVNV